MVGVHHDLFLIGVLERLRPRYVTVLSGDDVGAIGEPHGVSSPGHVISEDVQITADS